MLRHGSADGGALPAAVSAGAGGAGGSGGSTFSPGLGVDDHPPVAGQRVGGEAPDVLGVDVGVALQVLVEVARIAEVVVVVVERSPPRPGAPGRRSSPPGSWS